MSQTFSFLEQGNASEVRVHLTVCSQKRVTQVCCYALTSLSGFGDGPRDLLWTQCALCPIFNCWEMCWSHFAFLAWNHQGVQGGALQHFPASDWLMPVILCSDWSRGCQRSRIVAVSGSGPAPGLVKCLSCLCQYRVIQGGQEKNCECFISWFINT